MFTAIITGNIVANATLNKTSGGLSVANFTIVTNEYSGGKNYAEYSQMELWGTRADNMLNGLSKGQTLSVTARKRTRKWTDSNGVTRYNTTFVIDNIEYVGKKVDRVESTDLDKQVGDVGSVPSVDQWLEAYDNAPESELDRAQSYIK